MTYNIVENVALVLMNQTTNIVLIVVQHISVKRKGNNMDNANTRVETREAEITYVTEIYKDMIENGKHYYTNSYDFKNQDRVKITIEIFS